MYKTNKANKKWFVDVEYLGQVYSLPMVHNFYGSPDPMFHLVIIDDQKTKQVCELTVSGLCCRLDVWGIDNHYEYKFNIPFSTLPVAYIKEIEYA